MNYGVAVEEVERSEKLRCIVTDLVNWKWSAFAETGGETGSVDVFCQEVYHNGVLMLSVGQGSIMYKVWVIQF